MFGYLKLKATVFCITVGFAGAASAEGHDSIGMFKEICTESGHMLPESRDACCVFNDAVPGARAFVIEMYFLKPCADYFSKAFLIDLGTALSPGSRGRGDALIERCNTFVGDDYVCLAGVGNRGRG